MGKELESSNTNTSNDQPLQGPRIIKLRFKVDKLKGLANFSSNVKTQTTGAMSQSRPKTNFMIGDNVLSLSQPQHSAPIQEMAPEMLRKTPAIEAAMSRENNLDRDDINTVSQDQLMNLNESELKYLKNVVINKYKDENHDKLYRSKRRYGW